MSTSGGSFPLKVSQLLTDQDPCTNMAYLSPCNINIKKTGYVRIKKKDSAFHIFRVKCCGMRKNEIALSETQKRWTGFHENDFVECIPTEEASINRILGCVFEVALQKRSLLEPEITLDTDDMACRFNSIFKGMPLNGRDNEKQELDFEFQNGKYILTVAQLFGREVIKGAYRDQVVDFGLLQREHRILFMTREKSKIKLVGDSKGVTVIPKYPDLRALGIGGLEKQFNDIFRRIVLTRLLPETFVTKHDIKHVRGILLNGPPGTGKTLMARKIGNYIKDTHQDKVSITIVDGPSIVSKYVGQSAKELRDMFLFAPEIETPDESPNSKTRRKQKEHDIQLNYTKRHAFFADRRKCSEAIDKKFQDIKDLRKSHPEMKEREDILFTQLDNLYKKLRKLEEDGKALYESEKRLKEPGAEDKPSLLVVIFDEMDAICKRRSGQNCEGGDSVNDSIVSQLLTLMDGVKEYNNILLIGTTNRRDMIDDALLRPGRFEVEDIDLPDKEARYQILDRHTAKFREEDKLADDVDLQELAGMTDNATGAELMGLVQGAYKVSHTRLLEEKKEALKRKDPNSARSMSEYDPRYFKFLKCEDGDPLLENMKLTRADFEKALEYNFKPAFGTRDEDLDEFIPKGIIVWGDSVELALENGKTAIGIAKNDISKISKPVAMLVVGSRNSGKTALAVEIARRSRFPFIKMCTTEKMIGFTDIEKCMTIKKIFYDAAKSDRSVIILDDIECLINFYQNEQHGSHFRETVVQCIRDLLGKSLPKRKRMVIIGTTSCRDVLKEVGLLESFSLALESEVCKLKRFSEVETVLKTMKERVLTIAEVDETGMSLMTKQTPFNVGIKDLLETIHMIPQVPVPHRVEKFLLFLRKAGFIIT